LVRSRCRENGELPAPRFPRNLLRLQGQTQYASPSVGSGAPLARVPAGSLLDPVALSQLTFGPPHGRYYTLKIPLLQAAENRLRLDATASTAPIRPAPPSPWAGHPWYHQAPALLVIRHATPAPAIHHPTGARLGSRVARPARSTRTPATIRSHPRTR